MFLRIRSIILPAVTGLICTPQNASYPKTWTTAEDYRNMLDQLGIKALRPGPSGNEAAPNNANYDESIANPFPDYPDILKRKDGRPVNTPDLWWSKRRPEIVEDFEREVLGRVPPNTPKIIWSAVESPATGEPGARRLLVASAT